jgi:DNA-binding transcriptional LysR family regulator
MATKHVDALEARFGVKLLHRTTRGLSLTDAGREYLEGCQRILQDLDEVESDISAQRQEAKGRLRVNVPLSFGIRFIAPLIPGFTQRYPMVDVELGLSDSRQNLFDGSWDLIFRVGYLADSDLRARRLGDSPMRVCASPTYLAKHGTPHRVSDLSSHNCMSYTLSPFQSKGFWAFGHHGEIEVP